MAGQCEICGKRPQFGYNVSFSQRHTKRRWLSNVQRVTVRQGERMVRMRLCTRCMRTLSKS